MMAAPTLNRKKKKKRRRSLVLKYWWLAPVLGCVAMIGWLATGPQWSRARIFMPGGKPIAGYAANPQKMTQEYRHFYGKPLNNPEIERAFVQAGQHVSVNDYTSAVGLLEQVSEVASVPVVFNNLGLLYAELNDKSRAISAFREALGRDMDYAAARSNLDRLKDVVALGGAVTREVEPNNDTNQANIVALGKAVEGEIDAAVDDDDFFRVITPPAPRDLISIEIQNHSTSLAPVLRIFDQERRMTDWGKVAPEPGSSLQQTIAPAPDRKSTRLNSSHLGISYAGFC